MEALVERLEAATSTLERASSRLEAISTPTTPLSPSPSSTISPSSLLDLDEIIKTSLVEYKTSSKAIGGLVLDQSAHVVDAFTAMRGIVATAATTKKPDGTVITALITPLQIAIGKIVGIKDMNRPSKQFNHLSVVAEGIPALGWVVVEPAPGPYVGDMKDAALFYVNRVIKEFKGVYVFFF
jgi:adenylyl cyclase-associated protein